jgi:hypothetical protein
MPGVEDQKFTASKLNLIQGGGNNNLTKTSVHCLPRISLLVIVTIDQIFGKARRAVMER